MHLQAAFSIFSAVFAAAGWGNGGGHLGFKGWCMKVVMMKLVGAGKLER
jgi:hypothetical protein